MPKYMIERDTLGVWKLSPQKLKIMSQKSSSRGVASLQTPSKLFSNFSSLALVLLCVWSGQQTASAKTPNTKHTTPMMTTAQKIALAMSGGPSEIAKNATIMDMTDMSVKPTQLRAGTNGWVCSAVIGMPMCLDKQWQKWMDAWMNKSELKVEGTGIGYMLRGDQGASNTDPFATGPTANNEWVVAPPHVMVLYQDPKMLDAYPTDPKNGGPWVMWKGSPYAHVMVPVSPSKAAMMPSRK
jgi:hypothetical protein